MWVLDHMNTILYEPWTDDEEVLLIENVTTSSPYVTEGLVTLLNSPDIPCELSPSDDYFTGNEPFTIMMTVKTPVNRKLLYQHELGGQQNRMKLELNYQQKISILFFAQNEKTNQNEYPNMTSPTLAELGLNSDEYLHIVIVRDNPNLIMYINNQHILTYSSMRDEIVIQQSVLPLLLGSDDPNMHIASFAYYNRALSREECERNYAYFMEGI